VTYSVDVNGPCCNGVVIPQTVMVGFPIYPKPDVEFTNVNDSLCLWKRVRYEQSDTDSKSAKKEPKTAEETERIELSREFSYTPCNDDIGCKLAFTFTPRHGEREGKPLSVESKYEVTAGPGLCPFEHRHLYTSQPAGSEELVFNTFLFKKTLKC